MSIINLTMYIHLFTDYLSIFVGMQLYFFLNKHSSVVTVDKKSWYRLNNLEFSEPRGRSAGVFTTSPPSRSGYGLFPQIETIQKLLGGFVFKKHLIPGQKSKSLGRQTRKALPVRLVKYHTAR